MRTPPDVPGLVAGIRAGDRGLLSRAITLVESTHPHHREAARGLLRTILTDTAAEPTSWRVAVSGTPGAGKSTFIEALGEMLTAQGRRVGVLAIDPSSTRTGGSVLGDKTRMNRLSNNPRAYIRPSPSAGTLGGVARATAQSIPLLEAAGFDVILVETVGVGQSEITASTMVDSFLLLGIARSGDQLQGIKRGVLEIADVIAINKADGDGAADAREAARELSAAMRLVYAGTGHWVPPVVTCSAVTGIGVDDVWAAITRHREFLGASGVAAKRRAQQLELVDALVRAEVMARLTTSPYVSRARERARADAERADFDPVAAADDILRAFDDGVGRPG